MSEGEPAQPGGPLELDPFGFLIGVASRVPGLGGAAPGHDPTYVFHVPYVTAARGPAAFTVAFDNLRAKNGTLTLRVHMLPDEPGAIARLVNSARIQLNRLVRDGGVIAVGFEGYRGVTYAIMGSIGDQTDIQADGLRVYLDRPADAQGLADSFVDARSTAFGSDKVHASAHMISAKPATMAAAVSQPYGIAQMREPVTETWRARLAVQADTGVAQWQLVYKLQVLESYGMLEPGARALGFTRDDAAFVTAIEANGLSAVIADPGAERLVADMDPLYPPAALVNFDILWASDPGAGLSDAGDMIRFVENALSCLRPGGLAIFVFATRRSSVVDAEEEDDAPGAAGVRLSRIEIERIALMLISRRNEVAQLKPMAIGDPDGGDIFALIARKPRSVL
jgi:hypothetical protein